MVGGRFFRRREHVPTILKGFPMRSIVVNYAQIQYLLLSVITPDNYIVLLVLHALVLPQSRQRIDASDGDFDRA